ncbi:MAG: amino acid ABC transporter substrate-binding protein [Lachnospiraceae bacterium]|nr:amino acid ABC transporter substrate-binding protein [Lachnospiraceae bacterium]
MKNFKKLLVVALAATMVLGMVACKGSSDKKKDSKKTVENTDQNLVVGFDQNFPPFGYVGKDGEFTGFDIELAAEAAKRMGVDVVYQPIDWDAKDMELSSGTIDCIWNGFTVNGREDQYAWSDAYMNNAQVFVVRADSGIKSEKDLKGKIVDVQKESSAETALKGDDNKALTDSFSQLISVADYNTAMMDLESGAVDAVAMDKFVALDQTKDKSDTFKVLSYEISSEQYAVGFDKKNTALRDKVNKALKEMNADGTFAKISKKYFGEDVSILK